MDQPSRSRFFGSAAGLGFAMGLTQTSEAQNSQTETGKFEVSAATRRLLSQFGLNYPIFQAGIGSSSSPDLAIAVSSAGEIGGMTVRYMPARALASCAIFLLPPISSSVYGKSVRRQARVSSIGRYIPKG
jgi:hypothetical protein